MFTESSVTTAPGFGSAFVSGWSSSRWPPRNRKNHAAATATRTSGRTTSIFLDFLAGPPSPAAAPPAVPGAPVTVGVDMMRSWVGKVMVGSHGRKLGGDLGDERADGGRLVTDQH